MHFRRLSLGCVALSIAACGGRVLAIEGDGGATPGTTTPVCHGNGQGCMPQPIPTASPTPTTTPGPNPGPTSDPPMPPPLPPTFDAGFPTTCSPDTSSPFAPTWKAPTAAHQAACTQMQIDGYLTGCLGPTATQATCAPFQTGAGLKCAMCIETRDTDAVLGPLVSSGGNVTVNIAGCVANAQNMPSGSTCARAIQATGQCEAAECAANCPVVDDGSLLALQQCNESADVGQCSPYAKAAECTSMLTGDATQCLVGNTFEDSYKVIVPLFCLP